MSERTENLRQRVKMILVFTLCAATASGGAYYLFKDIREVSGVGRGDAMAKLEQKESKVRRKPSNSFSWSNIQVDQPLFKKDSIHTGPESTAVVRMKEGASIELGENSLIVIDRVDQLAFNPIKGNFVIRTKEGDQKVKVGADGKTTVEMLPVHLLTPAPFSVLFSDDQKSTQQVLFNWEVKSIGDFDKTKDLLLEIAKDKTFKLIVRSEKIKNEENASLHIELPLGVYYWRLSQSGKALAESNRFYLRNAPLLTPVDPTPGSEISLFSQNPTLQFKWNVPSSREQLEDLRREGVSHFLEISNEQQFKNVILSKQIDGASGAAKISDVPFGELYWRIRSVYGKSKTDSHVILSDRSNFKVERAQAVVAEAVTPQDGATKELTPQVSFRWEVESGAADFEYLLVLSTQDGKSIFSQKTNNTQWTWKAPTVGKYIWQVKVIDQGKEVGESRPAHLSVYAGEPLALILPEKNEDHYYWNKPEYFEFEWKKDDLIKKENATYELQVAKDLSFKDLLASVSGLKDEEVSSDKVKLESGSYFWRVRLVDQLGAAIKISEARKVSMGLHPRLTGPVGSQPVSGYAKVLSEDEKELRFSWESLKGAKFFEWVMLESSSIKRSPAMLSEHKIQGKVIATKKLTEPKFSIHFEDLKNIPPGKYSWTVRAFDPIGRAGEWMPLREVKIEEGELLTAPDILSPEVQ